MNYLKQLAKLRQFPQGGNVSDYLIGEMRQNLIAIEDAFKNAGKSVSELQGNLSNFQEYSGQNSSQTILSSVSNQLVEIISISIPGSAKKDCSYVIQTKALDTSGNPFTISDTSGGGVQFYMLLKVGDTIIYKGPSVYSLNQPPLCFISAPGDINPGSVLKLFIGIPATHAGAIGNLKMTARALPY